ncbi:MAG: isoprenylcysteine carboxylmethyltransferase family protein [Candidatus Altiarchaeota archaeon]|nr:isoprenylcysteine carboxylmethyltransferase family protein [Candidatus Altiarchaeota archaeon]
MKHLLRFLVLALSLPLLLFPLDLLNHFEYHLLGSLADGVVVGEWYLVAFNILLFTSFLIPLSFRRKVDWREKGLVAAFFTSLFIEMYGLPLTIFLIAGALHPTTPKPHIYATSMLLGVPLALSIGMLYGLILMVFGAALILLGWVTLYRNTSKGLVTSGIYSISRHPQYVGFVLVVFGWWVGWPTLLTTVFAPVLIYKYVRLCRAEEKEVGKNRMYQRYMKETPMLI